MAVKWTRNQQAVVDFGKGNLLVSAAAGSGKTAVLTAHIVKRITDAENPVDLDKLLVVTFTNAAAAEMKERIRKNLEERLEAEPDDANLLRQISLIPSANISTIHSFCLKLVREQFHRIDLDPGFRMADDAEMALMQTDVLEALLEEQYEAQIPSFLAFWDMYGSTEQEDAVSELILKLYSYAQSYPDPGRWLSDCVDRYRPSDGKKPVWTRELAEDMRGQLRDLGARADRMYRLAQNGGLPDRLLEVYESDRALLKNLAKEQEFFALCQALSEVSFARKPSAKKEDRALWEQREEEIAQTLRMRDSIRDGVAKLKKSCLNVTEEQNALQQMLCLPMVEELVRLTGLFSERFSQAKRAANLCDFSDLEHYALQVLYEDGKPSKVADRYGRRFEEILIDEYQDCNDVQEAFLYAVSRERFGENNRFMVGDVKQSIYGFRQAKPAIFMEKYRTYSGEETAASRRIELSENFRSRAGVLEAINAIFTRIMTEKLGGIPYDEKAALHPAADYPPCEGAADMEILLLDLDGEQEEEPAPQENAESAAQTGEEEGGEAEDILQQEDAKEQEACLVAARIQEMLDPANPCQVYDSREQRMRPVQLKDIAILLRSGTGFAQHFVRVLQSRGIACFSEKESGYFSAIEVQNVMDYLRMLDNPMQDIPLVASLRCAFGNFTLEELAQIRLYGQAAGSADSFYACVQAAIPAMPKLEAFWKQARTYRKQAAYLPLHELITRILEETGYWYYVSAMPAGERRTANLKMLIQKAKNYEETSYHGLFHFIRYMDKLRKYEVDFENPSTYGEEMQAVRILTVHKSKGLEFPVVFLCGLGKEFNQMDLNAAVLFHSELGIAMDVRDPQYHYKARTLYKKAVQNRLKNDLLAEELRILYVAMTRAKERLILTAAVRKVQGKTEAYEREEDEEELSYYSLTHAKSYLDFVMPALLQIRKKARGSGSTAQRRGVEEQIDTGSCRYRLASFSRKEVVLQDRETELPELPDGQDAAESGSFQEQIFNWKYPHEPETKLHASMSVSEIKRAAMQEEESVPLFPEPLSEDAGAASGTSRGTAYHKVLELLDFSICPESVSQVEEQMEELVQANRISREETDLVSPRNIFRFFASDLGKEMCLAAREGRLEKEKQFLMGVAVSEVYPEIRSADRILVKGIIDGYFEKDGGICLVDYKTDRLEQDEKQAEETLKRRYRAQLQYYSKAITQLMGKKVTKAYLYSFSLGRAVEVEMEQ